MTKNPGNFSRIWQELKNRIVIRFVTVYVAVDFWFLELIDIISGPLHIPGRVLPQLGEKVAGWEKGSRAIHLDSTLHFRYIEFLAVQDRKKEAFKHIELALINGFRDLVWIKLIPDISLLKDEDRYSELIDEFFGE